MSKHNYRKNIISFATAVSEFPCHFPFHCTDNNNMQLRKNEITKRAKKKTKPNKVLVITVMNYGA